MTNRRLLIGLLAVLVVLAGCAGGTGTDAGSTAETAETTAAETTSATATETATATPTATATATPTASPTPTPDESWTEPQPPNSPREDKVEDGRIKSVEYVNVEEGANGEGVSSFDLRVRANTSMEDVDPAKYGDVEGEPYFLVYVNDTLTHRSDYVAFEEDGEWTLDIPREAWTQFDEGPLKVKVQLVDRDSEYDDVYGVWTDYDTVYNPVDSETSEESQESQESDE